MKEILLNAKQRKIEFSMVVIVTQTVNSQVGTNLSDVIVLNLDIFLLKRKFVVAVNKWYVQMMNVIIKKKNKNKRRFRAFLLY